MTPGNVLQIQVSDLQESNRILSSMAGTLEDVERQRILQLLREAGAVIGGPHGAAVRLGLKRTTLLSKMQKLGIARNTNYSPLTQEEASKRSATAGKALVRQNIRSMSSTNLLHRR